MTRDLGNARKALEKLHLGAGVRHERLRERLGPELRRIWRITARDPAEFMAQTIVRLDQSLADLPSVDIEVARVAYHLRPDPELIGRKYLDRLEVLSGRRGPGHARRSLERRLAVARQQIVARLEWSWGPVPADEVRAVLDRERAARPPEPTDDSALLRDIGRLLAPQDPAEAAINGFLTTTMQVPRAAENGFAIARTAGHGDWLCAFTSPSRLAEYQRKVNPPWSGRPFSMTGGGLLRELREQALRVGVLVNPEPDRNADPTATLPLSPQDVEQIAARLA